MMTLSAPLLAKLANRLAPANEGFNLGLARRFKAALGIPVTSVGGFHTGEAMARAISDGFCDAVSVGRAMLADPLLYRHLREGKRGPECVYCNGCIARIGGRPATCYHPRVRRERDAMLAREAP
jgi:2,4-dienoyl-CoA reductase-like NADH-dependent reductase (Old Yellow Enzyme family)